MNFLLKSLFVLLLSFSLNAKEEKNVLYIHANEKKQIKLKILDFQIQNETLNFNAEESSQAAQSLKNILSLTGWFDFVSDSKDKSQTLYSDYEVSSVIKASSKKDKLLLELKLWNSQNGKKFVLGKLYKDLTKDDITSALRRFSDVMLESITGKLGPFMSKIVFVGSEKFGQAPEVYMSNMDGSHLKKVTDNGKIHISPSWSPDGKKVTFTEYPKNKKTKISSFEYPSIFVYNLFTKVITKLTHRKANSSGASWSPDGKEIAFSGSYNGDTRIYKMTSYGANVETFIKDSRIQIEPAYSPCGNFLAFTSTKYYKPMIFIRDLKTNEDKRLTFRGWYNASPAWSPDGKKIAFASFDRTINRWDIFTIHVDGTHLERLTIDSGDNERPSFSPDGRFILFQSTRGYRKKDSKKITVNSIETPAHLYIMGSDGSNPTKLNIPLEESRLGAWGPRLKEILKD